MAPPMKGWPMLLYLTTTDASIGGLIAQDHEGVERPIYYLSRSFKGPEERYSPQEKLCLALVYATQKFKHYFMGYPVLLKTRSQALKFLLQYQGISRRMSRWALMLSEFDITISPPSRLKSQALADMLALLPSGQHESLEDEVPGDLIEVGHCDEEVWAMYFDGSPSWIDGGAGVVLEGGSGKEMFSYKLTFPCTNNEAEYEALILGLKVAKEKGIKKLRILGDSKLILKQMEGEYGVKEASLAVYKEAALALLQEFDEVSYVHVPRTHNREADALATLGARAHVQEEFREVVIMKKGHPSYAPLRRIERVEKEDWRTPLIKQLQRKSAFCTKATKNYVMHLGVLYRKENNGLLMRCVGQEEGIQKAKEIHDGACEANKGSLYRRSQRAGCFWPTMKKDCDMLQRECEACKEVREENEVKTIEEGADWRRSIIEFLSDGVLPISPIEAKVLQKKVERYFMQAGELFKRRFNGEILRCIGRNEGEEVLRSVHEGECGRHQGGRALSAEVLRLGYYWPTLEGDAWNLVRSCQPCQQHSNIIHAPAVNLHPTFSPYPFHTWAFDFVGPINPPSRGKKWILAATE